MGGILTCKVCGKKYEGCRTAALNGEAFRWQEVACSPECGAEYFRAVMEARGFGVVDSTSAVDAVDHDDEFEESEYPAEVSE